MVSFVVEWRCYEYLVQVYEKVEQDDFFSNGILMSSSSNGSMAYVDAHVNNVVDDSRRKSDS